MAENQSVDHEMESAREWRERPWVLAVLLGLAGLLIHLVADTEPEEPWRVALVAAFIFGPLAASFTLSKEHWLSSVIFSSAAALVIAGIAWRAASAAENYADEEFWIAAGVLAITLSLPLFQAGFHKLRWRTSYQQVHFHVWTDAITGAGALAFVGLSWALLFVVAELFSAIQIDMLKDLAQEDVFALMFSGVAFGAALGVLRNQLKIIGTLRNVVLLVLSILAVPLAVALLLFLLAVLVSGIDVLWAATQSATPLLLAIAVGCFVLANAVVRDDDEEASNSRVLRLAGLVLVLGILPLSLMAAVSMGTRIAQHGLSPERLWALVAIALAVTFGVAYCVSVIRGRREGWRDILRQSNLHLAAMTAGLALLLAMPIFNFGSISASNQLARLASGAVSVEDFDYGALRWQFGEAGRDALAELTGSDDAKIAELATAADQAESQYDYRRSVDTAAINQAPIEVEDDTIRIAVRSYLQENSYRCRETCRVVELGSYQDKPLLVLLSEGYDPEFLVYDEAEDLVTSIVMRNGKLEQPSAFEVPEADANSTVELRPFEGQQLYIDGKPASGAFE
ncbi:MAG: DUF4153 domain-containing protein [Pseudomonadota bacterium]